MIQAGDRILTILEVLVIKGTTTTVFGTQDIVEGKNAWKLPLDEATVERLARAAYEAFWRDDPDSEGGWMGELTVDNEREDWRKMVRVVIAALVEGEQG